MAAGGIEVTRRGLWWRHCDFLLPWSAQGVSAAGSRTALPMAAILAIGADPYELFARRRLPGDRAALAVSAVAPS